LHYTPPKQLSKGRKIAIIIGSILAGLIILVIAMKWYIKKHPIQEWRRRETRQGVQLEDVRGGVEEEGERPPQYARIGKRGEVPPSYDASLNESGIVDIEDHHEPLENAAQAPRMQGVWRTICKRR
jgi:hypothetical protein